MKQKKPEITKNTLAYSTCFKADYLKPKYWGAWVAVLFLWSVTLIPATMQDALANKLGYLLKKINKKRRRIAEKNIELCFPEMSKAEKKEFIGKIFRHQARTILHLGVLWWSPAAVLEKRIIMKGHEHIDKALKDRRGVIIMLAHGMGLEAATSSIGIRYLASGMFKPLKNKLVDWFFAKGRLRHGGYSYTRDAGLRPIIKDVRAGNVAIYLPDEDLGADRSIFAPFFGVEKASVPVLGRLAKSCRADVFPSMGCYDEKTHQYIVHILPPLENFPSGDDYKDTLAMNQSIEKVVCICPSQYFWTLKLFKTRPKGEQQFY